MKDLTIDRVLHEFSNNNFLYMNPLYIYVDNLPGEGCVQKVQLPFELGCGQVGISRIENETCIFGVFTIKIIEWGTRVLNLKSLDLVK